ncbi:MAG: hypothetical protein AAFW82_03655 [Pseudomonadota bacterium]
MIDTYTPFATDPRWTAALLVPADGVNPTQNEGAPVQVAAVRAAFGL